jgi:hypothetical protein
LATVRKTQTSSRWRALARHDPTFAATPTFRALTHTRRLDNGNGKERENGRKSAENGATARRPKTAALAGPESRRLRRNGRFDRNCHHRPQRKKRDARGVKIEIAPLYVDN